MIRIFKRVLSLAMFISVLVSCFSIASAVLDVSQLESGQNQSLIDYSNNFSNFSIKTTLLKLPLSFIENCGQLSEDVKFMVKNQGQTVFFTPSEIVFALSSENKSSVVRMSFINSNPRKIIGEERLPGTANFFIGNDSSKWVEGVPTYSAIRYKDLYPGVDLVFKGTEEHLKHELILSPGTDPDQIILAYNDQDNLSLDQNGSVIIRTATGNITDSAPFCYQEINGIRKNVDGNYRKIDDKRIGFDIGDYNKSYPLVIDPELKYSTYVGGSHSEEGYDIAVDRNGNAYVTGSTESTNYPTRYPYQSTHNGYGDVFVTKLNSTLTGAASLVYSTYLGGSVSDTGRSIAVDSSGNAYVTGSTGSTDFPLKNAYQYKNAGWDAFVTKLSPTGNTLVYSTYLGGSRDDGGNGITADDSGNAYVTGSTGSTDFPTRYPYQATNTGLSAAFITKMNPSGGPVYSTYLGGKVSGVGGSVSNSGMSIAVDASGSVYVAGTTTATDFPIQNPYQSINAGGWDAFVAKLSPAGDTLVYSTYLGGSVDQNGGDSDDKGYDIAVDASGNAFVTGTTTAIDFPTQNPYQATNAGALLDAFVTKLSSSGNFLVYSTYLGGSSFDQGRRIAIDSSGNAYVTGYTSSTNFPTQNPYQATNVDGSAFVTKLNPTGNTLVYSTYLGGNDGDLGWGIAIDSSENVYVAGYTSSTDFPTRYPYQSINKGYSDVFVTVFAANAPPNTPSIPSGFVSGRPGTTYSYSTSAIDPDEDKVQYTFRWGDGTTTSTSLVNSGTIASATHIWSTAGTYHVDAMATDSKGATSGWSSYLTVVINTLPETPSVPSGPTSGDPGTSYSYSTSAIDLDGDQVKYTFDWGDGTTSVTSQVNSGTEASASHAWSTAGIYLVKAMATDSKGATSGWSGTQSVSIGNIAPNNPSLPVGPATGTAGTSYSYLTSATDPDGDQIAYTFDWGDGTSSTTALFDSGAIANATHIWNTAGIYAVKAKATDSNGLDSGWSNAINVSIANNSCISGTKFNDSNSNATRDPGEAGLSGWTIRLTRPDGTTINATTDASGGYKFENLTSGTYRVSEVRQSNWTQTYPAWLGDHIINVTDGNVTGVDFGNNFLPVPDIPYLPSGPASGILGAEYSYSTSSTDPSGYQIAYTFDWGDGTNSTTGLFDSGATASAAHIWNSSGVYQVRAMATNSKGASSGWSSELEVSIEEGDIPDQIGVFRNGGLYFDANGDGYWTAGDTTGWFGTTGDLPVAGDWDGNGKDEIAVFRNGGWYFDANGDGYWSTGDTTGWFGATGDGPVAGRWGVLSSLALDNDKPQLDLREMSAEKIRQKRAALEELQEESRDQVREIKISQGARQ